MGGKEHVVKEVAPGSIAEEMGIEAGDSLLAVNDNEIEDVFDYRYLMKDEYVEVLVRKPDGEEWLLEIDKDYDEDLGVEFENGLMSEYRSCSNKCIFCFIPEKIEVIVDFPEPFSPINPRTSPLFTVRSTWSRATTGPKILVICLHSMTIS